jgi:FecR protein
MAARIFLPSFLLGVSLLTGNLRAGTLSEAHVTRIINDVKLVEPSGTAHPAKLEDVVQGDIGLRTGVKSRSELLFQDDTLSRIGPESYFRFRSGTREITLERGTLLLQVPKGLGGAKIHTAAVTASITGTTIMIEHQPNQSIKVMVLEGSLRLSVNGPLGDSLVLQPGKMVIMKPDAKRIPDPVTGDLKKVLRTSKLVNMPQGKKGNRSPLPSIGLIDKEVALQEKEKNGKELVDTNLVIAGKGTKVLLASAELQRGAGLLVPGLALS